MNATQVRKQLLLERIESNRQLTRLEVQALRNRVSSVVYVVDIARRLVEPVGALAAVAGAAVAKRPGKAGGLVGLAALVPVVLTVAKLIATSHKGDGAGDADEATPDGESKSPPSRDSEPAPEADDQGGRHEGDDSQ